MTGINHGRQLGMMDFVKAAFNLKVQVPGIGGLPVNWLFMGLAGGLAIAAWPLGLMAGSLELAYLFSMSSSTRFQMAVRSQLGDLDHEDEEERIDDIVYSLDRRGARTGMSLFDRYMEFKRWCDEVLSIAETCCGKAGSGMLGPYKDNLLELRLIYAKLANMIQGMESNIGSSIERELGDSKAAYEREMSELPDDHPAEERASLQGTIDILEKRLEMQRELKGRLLVARCEMRRLDEQVRLLRDQVLLSKDPSVLSVNLDATTAVLDTHSEWMRDNQSLIQQ